jgi:hypothetical protein
VVPTRKLRTNKTGGKFIAVCTQSVSAASTVNPVLTFITSTERDTLFFISVPNTKIVDKPKKLLLNYINLDTYTASG